MGCKVPRTPGIITHLDARCLLRGMLRWSICASDRAVYKQGQGHYPHCVSWHCSLIKVTCREPICLWSLSVLFAKCHYICNHLEAIVWDDVRQYRVWSMTGSCYRITILNPPYISNILLLCSVILLLAFYRSVYKTGEFSQSNGQNPPHKHTQLNKTPNKEYKRKQL